ncbi:hypothetical protein DL93DRAFT_2080450 [Clavulina sp. PMI_390]|nr:hypothetical protein DL93DRAFT_2080450 [Clavulina sp. PMI_390]
MRITAATAFFLYLQAFVTAHGGHDSHDDRAEGESIKDYAKRHMIKEHHIDVFDLQSFFSLHDLNSDGILDADEIQAIYGVHHLDSQKKSPDEAAHQAKAQRIVREVLAKMDTNKDGMLSREEFEAAGFEGLPDFSALGAEGHHYDEESEFFLHHEEEFHNTPETQTDESYVHAEDIEHFQNHERIELEEENKERHFQGLSDITPEEMQKLHDQEDAVIASKQEELAHAPQVTGHVSPDEEGAAADVDAGMKVTYRRPSKKPDPKEFLKGAVKEASMKGEWGTGDGGYKRPKSYADKLRKNVPYKYKFRRNWGDF